MGTASAKECHLSRVGSIDFTIVNDTLLVPVSFDGHSAWMILDTADIATVMQSDYATRFGLKVGKLPTASEINFGPARIKQFSSVVSFQVGPVRFGKAEFLLVPGWRAPTAATDQPTVGILGLNAFSTVDFELDFVDHKLNLYSQDHCPGQVVFWSDTYSSAPLTRGPLGNIYFPIELEGKKIEATFSTTFAGNSLTTDVTRSLYGFDEKSTDIETDNDGSGRPVAHYRAMTLTANGFQVKNARIQLLTSTPAHCTLGYGPGSAAMHAGCIGGEAPLKLGLNVAQHLHLYFATKEKTLYFTDAAAKK